MAYVEVDIDLRDFPTNELIEELESRGHMLADNPNFNMEDIEFLAEKIYESRRRGENYDYNLNQLLWAITGRM